MYIDLNSSCFRENVQTSNCALLSAAGTASASFYKSLRHINPNNKNLFHTHWRRIIDLSRAPCYIMVIRNPVDRFRSGFRFSKIESAKRKLKRCNSFGPGVTKCIPIKTPNEFLSAYYDSSHRYHADVTELYNRSAQFPMYTKIKAWDSPIKGWNFLTSQVDYLRGYQRVCSTKRIRLICYDRLHKEWANMTNGSILYHVEHRKKIVKIDMSFNHSYLYNLYKSDFQLYDNVCNRKNSFTESNTNT